MTYAQYLKKTECLGIKPIRDTVTVSTIAHEIRSAIRLLRGRDILRTNSVAAEAAIRQRLLSTVMTGLRNAEEMFLNFKRGFDHHNTFIETEDLLLVLAGILSIKNRNSDIDEAVILAVVEKVWGQKITKEIFEKFIAAAKAVEA